MIQERRQMKMISSFVFRTDVSRRFKIGKTAETVTYFSPDITPVNSARGRRASLIAGDARLFCQHSKQL